MQKLADELGKRWTPADGISPWLRRQEPKLRRLVRDAGWNWADIGRAMTLAGITYASGTPWTGALLNVKMAQARGHLRTRDAKRTDGDRPPARPGPGQPPTADKAPVAATVTQDAPEPEPTFALAAFAPPQFSPPASSNAGSDRPSSALKRVDVDEIIRRLQGGDA